MKVIHTHLTDPKDLSPWEKSQAYNGLDCCVTLEVLDAMLPLLDDYTRATYLFSRELEAPVIEMRLRGVRVDTYRKAQVIDLFYDQLDTLEWNLCRIVEEGVGLRDFNWRSPRDLQALFYDSLGIPVVRRGGRPTVDRSALEKMETYLTARPIIMHMKAMRDIGKKIQMLKTEIDPDGRIRTDYNIAGTSTGRFSSASSEFGTGTNLQNVEESLRSIFIADEGMKLAKFDAKSGESYCVGAIEWNLFGDGSYLDTCESGDPHTATARICWPELGWSGSLKHDREIAERKYYRHYTYRFMCKKLGHGSNYGGQPATLSGQSKIPIDKVEDFQDKYFLAFPSHKRWHHDVAERLRRNGYLISLTGRKRWFFGRRTDNATIREALANDPQGSLADIVNKAMLKVWKAHRPNLSVYMHDHDALTFQYPEEQEDEIIPWLLENLKVEVKLRGDRRLVIPYDCVVGWNKGAYSDDNPDGLRDYHVGDNRKRSQTLDLLDRV